jgi:hypothetical protein
MDTHVRENVLAVARHLLDAAALVAEVASVLRMLKGLGSSTPDVRDSSLVLLGMLPPPTLVSPAAAVIRMLGDSSYRVRVAATGTASVLPVSALMEHMPLLLQLLNHDTADMRKGSLHWLGRLSPTDLAPHTVLLMRKAVYDEGEGVKEAAIRALCRVESSVLSGHTPVLWKALNSTTTSTCSDALDVLAALPPSALTPPASAFAQILSDHKNLYRERALQVLARLAPAALAPHAPAVMRMFFCELDYRIQGAAARVLSNADASVLAQDALEQSSMPRATLDYQMPYARSHALAVLSRLAPAALAPYAPVVLRMLSYPSAIVWQAAAHLASKFDEAVLAQHASIVREALNHSEISAREGAMRLLQPAGLPLALLRTAVFAPGREAREWAAATLLRLDVGTPTEHMSVLLEALGDRLAELRQRALDAFGKMPLASLAPLMEIVARTPVNSRDLFVRSWAVQALQHRLRALSSEETSMLTVEHVLMLRLLPRAVLAGHAPDGVMKRIDQMTCAVRGSSNNTVGGRAVSPAEARPHSPSLKVERKVEAG